MVHPLSAVAGTKSRPRLHHTSPAYHVPSQRIKPWALPAPSSPPMTGLGDDLLANVPQLPCGLRARPLHAPAALVVGRVGQQGRTCHRTGEGYLSSSRERDALGLVLWRA